MSGVFVDENHDMFSRQSWLLYFDCILYAMWLYSSVSFHQGAVDLYAVCDCGISWSYSLFDVSCGLRLNQSIFVMIC